MSTTALPIPSHFDPGNVESVWRVDYEKRATEARAWAARHSISPATGDEQGTCLLLVDCQNTFCLPDHELFVAGRSGRGAVEDNVRLARFIYRHLGDITEVVATLDTHVALQIFHPAFWINQDGEHPVGGQTIISADDVENGVWRVNPDLAGTVADVEYEWLQEYARHYVHRLAEGRYALMVWPYHAMLGGVGHALVSSIEEAIFFHAIARRVAPRFEIKGSHPLTEHYSALKPEVTNDHRGAPLVGLNAALVDHLLSFDSILVAGQAKSHCVAWTVHDLLDAIQQRDPTIAERVTLLDDCASPVVIPDVVDFTDQAEEAYEQFAAAGMRRARSTDL